MAWGSRFPAAVIHEVIGRKGPWLFLEAVMIDWS